MAIIRDKCVLHYKFQDVDREKAPNSEGKFATLTPEGEIALITDASTLPHGVVANPSGESQIIARHPAYGDLILYSSESTVGVQVGANAGTIKHGTLLKLNSDGTVSATGNSAGEVLVAMALEPLEISGAGQLIEAMLFAPYITTEPE